MEITRRHFTVGGVASAASVTAAGAVWGRPVKALAFDAFPVFDPRAVVPLAEVAFPGKGGDLVALWRNRQFEYTWLRTITGRYADFLRVTEEALVFAGKSLRLDLSAETRDHLVGAHFALPPWPDAVQTLGRFRQAGLRLAFLSNMTQSMLAGCIEGAGLADIFEHVLSTDERRTYKPDPRAYSMGVDAFGLAPGDILFVAFGGWDAAGAKAFGYPTYWVNRLGLPPEELGLTVDGAGGDLHSLTDFLGL
jgi:2-haloacid dehalogenase